jgi:hypothetical protein
MIDGIGHEAFILRTKAGQWMFQVHRDGEEVGGGSGFADQFEAIEAAQEAFGHVEGMRFVVQADRPGDQTVEGSP